MVNPNIDQDLETYEFGRKMRPIVVSPSWPDLIEYLKDYVNKIDRVYRTLPPGDPAVVAEHAALHALDEFVTKFERDLPAAVEFAMNPPQEVVDELMGIRQASDVMATMDGN